MKRTEWKFSYSADVLKKAAEIKCQFHQDRLSWWEAQKNAVITRIRAEGLEIDESLAAEMNVSNSYTRGPSIQIRNDFQNDLLEVVRKIREHREKLETYAGWVQILASQGAASLSLEHDDWLFFFNDPSKVGVDKAAQAA